MSTHSLPAFLNHSLSKWFSLYNYEKEDIFLFLKDFFFNFIKVNQNLEEIAQTLFKRWFINFEFPNEEGKPYKSSGGKMIESEIGEIPEKFYLKKAYEVCNLSIGKTPSRKDTECFKKKKEKGVK